MSRFISPYASLRLFGGPLGTVRFEDGRYETDDPVEVGWLRSHGGFGVDFFEEDHAQGKPASLPDPKALLAELEAVKAQNRELLARLAEATQNQGAPSPGQDQHPSEAGEPVDASEILDEPAALEEPTDAAEEPRGHWRSRRRGGRRP